MGSERIMLLKISRDKIQKIDIINTEGMTGEEVYKKYMPDFLINLALYDMATGKNITHLKDEGISSGYLFSDEGIGIKNDNEIIWTNKNDENVRDFVAGSPVLIKNGAKFIDWGNKKSDYVSGSHIRSAIGFDADKVILFNSDKKMDLNELSETLFSEKCQFAINCDGGGSCHLQEGSKIYKKSTRKNASWLLIFLKREIGYIDYGPILEVKELKKVFLGVGHGGKDPGAVANGLRESDINLSVAQFCKEELEKYNIRVLLSRYTDEDDSLAEEIKECNEFDPDIAIDIHTNAGGGDGFEVYHHSLGCNSKRLANFVEAEAKKLNNSRGVKTRLSDSTGKDYYGFIRDTNPPAIIVECAFIDNKEDVKVIDEVEEQKAFGIAYARGILKYFNIEVADTNVADLVLTIGKKEYLSNGIRKSSDVSPKIENGRTLVPIYLLRELGLTVEWKDDTKEVHIFKEQE